MKAFIFDMDGVIIDSQPIHFEVDALVLKEFGVDIDQKELEKYAGRANEDIWTDLKTKYNLKQAVPEIIEYLLSKKIQIFKESKNGPIEGIIELIQKLDEAKIPMAVASSSPRALIETVMEMFNIRDYFAYIISGDEVRKSKPEPDIYLTAARKMNVEPKDCVVLEDTKNGVMAAKAAGMKCIGFHNPNSGDQDLSKADVIVESIRDVIQMIG
ncbi:HAD family hydrolase [Defluviitalea saccharophila]|uniref:HAD family hydrolase n=1 Tax=Defluviitalea saccharophila TaxID=879970 RepID=A0ABZ2Y324_9FIRM|nr:HAD family hydrolase [Candidatus Epulonipiscium sp.]